MINLRQPKDFGTYLQDTIDLFKTQGKSFLMDYLKLCGLLLIITIGLNQILSSSSYEFINQLNTGEFDSEEFFSPINTLTLFIIFILSTIISIITFIYPMYFLNLYGQNKRDKASEYKTLVRKNGFRAFGFLFFSTLLLIPISMIAVGIFGALSIILIGIPLLILFFPTMASFFTLAFYDYMLNRNDFFASYGVSFRMLKANFGAILGNGCIILLLSTILISIPASILQFITFGSILQGLENPQPYDPSLPTQIITVILAIITSLFSYLVYLVFMINQGIVFFSEQERRDNTNIDNLIESIGEQDKPF
ncbi:hypothetical protein ACYSNX_00865 [Myroides sp. LJL115]